MSAQHNALRPLMRTPIVIGNWKMNTDRAAARELADAVQRAAKGRAVEVGIAPPSVYLADLAQRALCYGQNCHDRVSGAFTGELAASMLVDVGAVGVILGHSERRHGLGEDVAWITRKTSAALDAGLQVVLCVGETLGDRESEKTWDVVSAQLASAPPTVDDPSRLVIAYEPVWAIGTGRTASPEQAQEVHAKIRAWLVERFGADGAYVRIQYGGSVNAKNAATLLTMPDIDGALVGGASLDKEAFAAIIDAAEARVS